MKDDDRSLFITMSFIHQMPPLCFATSCFLPKWWRSEQNFWSWNAWLRLIWPTLYAAVLDCAYADEGHPLLIIDMAWKFTMQPNKIVAGLWFKLLTSNLEQSIGLYNLQH